MEHGDKKLFYSNLLSTGLIDGLVHCTRHTERHQM